jgi:NAD(P)-dependent dehydrogenase (short-subunit alcohol dehydrogenase family)
VTIREVIDVNLYGGIRFNTIRPGPTKTEIHEPGRIGRITPLLPMGRPGEPRRKSPKRSCSYCRTWRHTSAAPP